jgi:hypothetical protein
MENINAMSRPTLKGVMLILFGKAAPPPLNYLVCDDV